MSPELVTSVARVISCLAALAFSITYGLTAPWWRRAVSRNVMALMSAIGCFLVLGVIHEINPSAFDDWPWIRPIVWSVIATLLVQRFIILLREQVLSRRDGHAGASERVKDEDLRT